MSMFFKRLPNDLDYKIMTEEFDPETCDDKDEPDEINEKLFVGDNEAIDFVKSVYKNAKYIRFKSASAFIGTCIVMTICVAIMAIGILGLLIWLIPQRMPWFVYFAFSIGIIFLICGIWSIWADQSRRTYEGYFFKIGSKSTTFYLPKGGRDKNLIASFNKKSVFQYNPTLKMFIDITKTTKRGLMGNKLLFSYMYGMVESEKSRKQTIYYSNTSDYVCKMKIRDGKLKKMEHMLKWNPSQRHDSLKVYNYNDGDHVLDVPKAFLTLCEEKGINAPESEHIRYI